jgi:hypothetical protein
MTTSREQIEHAAQNLSSRTQSIREHSEQTLLSFRKSPEALYLCQDILINSQSIDAKFQASNALRFAILQKWDVMTNDMRAEIRQFCLKYLLHSQTTTETSSSSSRMSNVISSQIVSVLAVVLKRQWLDDDGKQRQMALEECERAVSSSATAGARKLGLDVFTQVVLECAPSTSSPMHLNWEFHERVRDALEKEVLVHFFSHAGNIAREVLMVEGGKMVKLGKDEECFFASLRLLNACLSWDFSRFGGFGKNGARGVENENGTTSNDNHNNSNSKGGRNVLENASISDGFIPVTPGETWRDVLLQSGENDTFAWLFSLHEAMHSPSGVAQNSADGSSAILPGTKVAKETRSLFSSFCALSGSIFPETDVHKQLKSMHFQRCAQSLLKTRTVMDPKDAMNNVDEREGEVLDCVKQLGTLCSAHHWTFLVAPCAATGSSVLEALTNICSAAIESGSLRAINDGSCLDLVMKNCFDAFAVLSSKVERNQAESPEMAMKINQEIAKICQRYVEFGLQSARESAYDEDDGHEEDGAAGIEALDVALDVVAELFRATVSSSVPMLAAALHEKINFLLQLAALTTDNAAHADLQRAPELFEELWWLLRLVGHVVADDGRGETPMRPLQFDENEQTRIALRQIGELFIGTLCVQMCENQSVKQFLSPRVVEQVVWCAARWADTHLFPEDSGGRVRNVLLNDNNLSINGSVQSPDPFEGEGGAYAAKILVGLATVAISFYDGETSLRKSASFRLLPSLTRRNAPCKAVANDPAWTTLLFSTGQAHENVNGGFPSEIFCGLTESLARAAIGIAEENDQRNTYLRYVLEPPSKVLLLAIENKKFIEHPTGESRTMGALEALRGVARASLSKRHEFSTNHFFEMLSPLTRVIENAISANSSLVISRAMKLSETLCEIFAMDEENTDRQQRIREFTLSIVSIFAKSEPTKMTAATLTRLRDEEIKANYKCLKSLLRALTHLASAWNDEDKEKLASVVFSGLAVVIPLLTPDALLLPKLRNCYFSLLSYSMESFADIIVKNANRMSELVVNINGSAAGASDPNALFFMILSTLEFGLDNDDENVCRESLVALGALAAAELRKQKNGGGGGGAATDSPLLMQTTQTVASFIVEGGSATADNTKPNALMVQLPLSPLGKCLRIVWKRLLFVDASGGEKNSAIVDEAADALLPLLQIENACFMSLGEETFEAAEKKGGRGVVVREALGQLTTARGLNAEVDRMNKRRFRRNLGEFVERVRGVVRSN